METIKSSFIFEIASKYGINYNSDKPFEFTDEQYNLFRSEYLQKIQERDIQLINYVTKTPKLFRTFLPWKEDLFYTVLQILWYYDELIIYDPIFFELTQFKTANIEENKFNLIESIKFLNNFKDSIDSGFILFAAYNSLAETKKEDQNINFSELISIPEIREELDKEVLVTKMEKISNGETVDYTIRTFFREQTSFIPIIKKPNSPVPNADGTYSWSIDLTGSNYIPMSLDEIKTLGYYHKVYENYEKLYPFEIKEILDDLYIGNAINTAVLFNRKLEELVLENLQTMDNTIKTKPFTFYELTLPFVDGIPPEKLLEIRYQIPSAFVDFRSQMVELIFDLQSQKYDDHIFNTKLMNKINPIIKNLDSEIKGSLRKAKLLGTGVPLISAVGAWGLWQVGLDITKLGSFIWSGVSIPAGLKILNDRLTEKNMEKNNPFYYLWKVKK